MSNSATNKTLLGILTFLGIALTMLQGLIPTMPPMNPETLKIFSASLLFAVNVTTVWKQYVSEDVANKAIKRTLIVAAIATITGIVDFTNVLHISDSFGQWIRFGFTFIALCLNAYSKQMFPSDSAIEQKKADELKGPYIARDEKNK